MCRNCVPTLMELADDYWRSADATMETAKRLKAKGAIGDAVEMQHHATTEQAFGMVFQALANIMASILNRDDPGEDHPSFNVPSQN